MKSLGWMTRILELDSSQQQRHFSSLLCPGSLWGPPNLLFSSGGFFPDARNYEPLNLHLVKGYLCLKLYIHFPIHFHGTVLSCSKRDNFIFTTWEMSASHLSCFMPWERASSKQTKGWVSLGINLYGIERRKISAPAWNQPVGLSLYWLSCPSS